MKSQKRGESKNKEEDVFKLLIKEIKPQILREPPKRKNIPPKTYLGIFKLLKPKIMGKSWRQPKIKDTLHIEEQKWELLCQKLCKPEDNVITYLKVFFKKNNLPTQNSIQSNNIIQKWRSNKDILDNQKQRKCITSRPLIQDMFKEII